MKIKYINTLYLSITLLLFLSLNNCKVNKEQSKISEYKTENIIVLVMDGPRYSETWGDSTHQYIPFMANKMAKSGVIFTNFFNDGFTYTSSGHTAICTGFKQEVENSKGNQLPSYPSYFQYYLKKTNAPSESAYIITSKDKLQILANCENVDFKNKYNPIADCGINGLGSGYRNDTTTFRKTIEILNIKQPKLLLVNFKEPDVSGHANKWNDYLKGIKTSDSLIYEIWKFIQNDPKYKNKTTLFVTNDHGRHLNGIKDGFVNHGCPCDGCRHINLFVMGPDFKKNLIIKNTYNQVDITATIAELLSIEMPFAQGKSIDELFIED
ncbi:MAG: hypothetical protein RLZZ175_1068 [Bacteroidota bacterium]|jgi:hypothetical protein